MNQQISIIPAAPKWTFMSFLMLLFFLTTLIAPTAIANKLVFLFLIASYGLRVALKGHVSLPTFAPFIVTLIFIYGFALSLQTESDLRLSVQLLTTTANLWLIYLIYDNRINIERIINISGVMLALATFIYYLASSEIMNSHGADYLLGFFNSYSNGASGPKHYTAEPIYFYRLGTVSFLFLPACLYFKKYLESKSLSTLLPLMMILLAILLSLSRGLIVAVVFGFLSILFFRQNVIGRVWLVTCSAILVVMIALYVSATSTALSTDDYSNMVKIGHMLSFIDNLSPAGFLFGDGLAAYFYSVGVERYVAQIEITLLDMLRYFGIFLTVILYFSLAFPVAAVKAYAGHRTGYVVLFLIYLLLSMSNPVLFNSYGMLVILWYWSRIIGHKPEIRMQIESAQPLPGASG